MKEQELRQIEPVDVGRAAGVENLQAPGRLPRDRVNALANPAHIFEAQTARQIPDLDAALPIAAGVYELCGDRPLCVRDSRDFVDPLDEVKRRLSRRAEISVQRD
jgi:hypothetical protein